MPSTPFMGVRSSWLVGALPDGLLEMAAVAAGEQAARVHAAPDVGEQQQRRGDVHGARGRRVPGRRCHVQRHAQLLGAPGALGVGCPHPEEVVAGAEVGVGGAVQCAGIDPPAIEAIQAVRIVVVGRRGEVERRELEADELVVIAEHERLRRPRKLALGQGAIEPRGAGQHDVRRRRGEVDRGGRKSVEAVVAAEVQRTVAVLIVGVGVEVLALQAVPLVEHTHRACARIEAHESVRGADPEPVLAV